MNQNWEKRIQKIEAILRSRSRPVAVFRYGTVKLLSENTVGERHIRISKSEPTALPGVEQCQFEEVPGSALVSDEHTFHVYLSLDDEDG
jgi:hypothetical protein